MNASVDTIPLGFRKTCATTRMFIARKMYCLARPSMTALNTIARAARPKKCNERKGTVTIVDDYEGNAMWTA